MSFDNIKITFDTEYKLRVLNEQQAKRASDLEQECGQFVTKLTDFHEKVTGLLGVLESHASRIDAMKLKAIGLRMATENEAENRSRQSRAINSLIAEKKSELDRYNSQMQSLERIESEQKNTLEKMSEG